MVFEVVLKFHIFPFIHPDLFLYFDCHIRYKNKYWFGKENPFVLQINVSYINHFCLAIHCIHVINIPTTLTTFFVHILCMPYLRFIITFRKELRQHGALFVIVEISQMMINLFGLHFVQNWAKWWQQWIIVW